MMNLPRFLKFEFLKFQEVEEAASTPTAEKKHAVAATHAAPAKAFLIKFTFILPFRNICNNIKTTKV